MQPSNNALQRLSMEERRLLETNSKQRAACSGHVARLSAGYPLKKIVEASWKRVGRGGRNRCWRSDVESFTGSRGLRNNMNMAMLQGRGPKIAAVMGNIISNAFLQ